MKLIKKLIKFVIGPLAIIFIGMPLLGKNSFMYYLLGTALILMLWFIPWELLERHAANKAKVYRRVVLENDFSADSNFGDLVFKSDTGFLPEFVADYSPIRTSANFTSDSYVSGNYNGVFFEQAHVNDRKGAKDYSGTLYVIHLDVNEEPTFENALCKVNKDNVCVYIEDDGNNPSSQKIIEIIDGLL